MKRYAVLTSICLVLALAALTVSGFAINSTETKVDQIILTTRGDASSLQGLTLKTDIIYNSKLQWKTTRDIGRGTSNTDFSFHHQSVNYGIVSHDYTPHSLYVRICNSYDENDPIFRYLKEKHEEGGEKNQLIRIKDFYDFYPLFISNRLLITNPYTYDFATIENRDYNETPFTLLQIPVEEEDVMLGNYAEYGYGNSTGYISIGFNSWANAFNSHIADCYEGALVSIGFAPGTKPQSSWAPEGFGIWLVPEGSSFHCDEAKLVYPLDIEKQKVLALKWSLDELSLYLVTYENNEAVLRILERGSYRLLQTIHLGEIGITDEMTTYQGLGDETTYQVRNNRFDAVNFHQEKDFTAIALGTRLIVLVPGSEGLIKDFSCDMIEWCFRNDNGELIYFWKDENPDAKDENTYMNNVVSPVANRYRMDFSQMAMAYKNHRLAIAWTEFDYTFWLHVYDENGIVYAEQSIPSLIGQDEHNLDNNPFGFGRFDHLYNDTDRIELHWR